MVKLCVVCDNMRSSFCGGKKLDLYRSNTSEPSSEVSCLTCLRKSSVRVGVCVYIYIYIICVDFLIKYCRG